EIGGPQRDHDEAPEDERVRDAAQVVRPLEQLPLEQVDDELVLEASTEVGAPVLVPAEPQVAVEPPRAVGERADAKRGDGRQGERAESLGRRYHRVTRACPRR